MLLTRSLSNCPGWFFVFRSDAGRKKYNKNPIAIQSMEYIIKLLSSMPVPLGPGFAVKILIILSKNSFKLT